MTVDSSERESTDWLLNLDDNIVEQLNRHGSSANLDNGQSIVLLLELKDVETEQWPRGIDGKHWIKPDSGTGEGVVRQHSGIGDGIVGLYNMGYVSSIVFGEIYLWLVFAHFSHHVGVR